MKNCKFGFVLLTCAAVTACGDSSEASKDNFADVIQKSLKEDRGYRKPGCMKFGYSFPFSTHEHEYDHKSRKQLFDLLTEAGLFTVSQEMQKVSKQGSSMFEFKEVDTEVFTYTPTDKSKEFVIDGALCYARPELVDVIRYSQPGEMLGVTISNVRYSYKITNFAPWADELPRMENIIAQDRATKDKPVEANITLVLTSDGWSTDTNM